MAAPAFKSHTTAQVATGNSAFSIAAPSGVASGDYQVVALIYASSSGDVGATPSGWSLLDNTAMTLPSGDTCRVAIYESTTATAAFAMTMTAARVWAAIRAAYTLPAGSSGRVKALGKTIETPTGGTSHTTPSMTTTVVDSLVLVWAGVDTANTSQQWTGVGSGWTQRAAIQGGNASERQAVVLADRTYAAATSGITTTLTSAVADEAGMYAIVLEGVASAPALEPVDVIPYGTASGLVHYAFDIGQENDGGRQLHPPSDLASGLEFDPEFLAVDDGDTNWVQAAVRADATPTSGSTNGRSEGRETQEGSDSNLGFDPRTGTHWQRVRMRVMEHPTGIENVGVSGVQLHSLADDILMVRTRVRADNSIDLVLREYDPGTSNSVDVLTLVDDYEFGDIVDLLLLEHDGHAYVFRDDFLVPVHRTNPAVWPVTGTYMHKHGCYNQGTASWPSTAWGRVQFRNVQHWHDTWAAPQNYAGWPEVDPGAAASATVGTAFTRTATDSGSGITERKWAILEGPTGLGSTIGTAAALSWTPTQAGTYTLVYGAKNAEGWSNPAFLAVTASVPSSGGVRSRTTGKAAAATTHSVTLPVTRQVGDRVFVGFTNDHADATAAPSTGWTSLGSDAQGSTTNQRLTVFTRVLDGGANDTLTVTITDATHANSVAAAWAVVCMNGNGGTPAAVFANGGSATTGAVTAHTGLASGDYDSIIFLGLDNSTAVAQTVTPPTGYDQLQAAGVSTDPVYAHSMEDQLSGVTAVSPANVTWTGAEQWVTAHVIVAASTATAPTVGAGADATIDQYDTFSRTATENANGAAITSRAWTVQSGPNQVGATIGTAAALSWAPTVGGVYVLRYTATNSVGSGFDEVSVTVTALVFPLTAALRLSGTAAGARHTASAPTGPLRLAASSTGAKQAVAAPSATVRLSASITGQRINQVIAALRLSAALTSAGSSNGAHVTASMKLAAAVTDRSRATPTVPVTAPLHLQASPAVSSARSGAVTAPLRLSATRVGAKRVSYAPTTVLRLSAAIGSVLHATTVARTGTLHLAAAVTDRVHTGGRAVTAVLRLAATPATNSTRTGAAVLAVLRLHGQAIGQRIVAELLPLAAVADTTVRYDLVAVARIPQAGGPPMFVEVDPIDWTDLTWTEAINEAPTLSANVKIGTLSEPILQRLRAPHELPTELWAYRNGRAVFAGPLLGGRVSGDSLSLEAAGIEAYLRWMHVVNDLQFTAVDQFSIVRALVDQWQGLEFGHFGIDSGSGVTGLLPDPIPGQAVYQAANRTAENSDEDLKVTRPSGTKAGDLLIAAHVCDTDGGITAMTAPTGWTLVGELDAAADIPNVKIWTKIATESEPSSYTFSQGDEDAAVQPLADRQTDAADTAGSRRVYSQAPAGMEERVDIGANSAVLGMFTQPLTADGATGTRTAACSGSHDWAAAALVVAPAPPTPPPLSDAGPLSGVTRSVSYFASELHNVADRVGDLAKAADGFTMRIDPTTRRLELYHPGRGVDRSTGEDAIIFDARNITNSDITFSISPADLASDGFATGTTGGSDAPRTARYSNLELRSTFGRTGITSTFEVTDQASLDAYVASLVDARDRVLLIPGPNARVTLDADLSAYDIEDTIAYHAHGRLTVATAIRIRKRTVQVSKAATENVAIEFA